MAVPATKASEALGTALDEASPHRVMSQTELARRVGVSQAAVSGWVNLQSRPEAHHRKAIDRILGIHENDWMTDSEQDIANGSANNDAA